MATGLLLILIGVAIVVGIVVGIPLAIMIRPSGKSWGILIAVGLMLIYYVAMQMGLAMVESTAIYCFVVSMILIFANPFVDLAAEIAAQAAGG